MNEESPSIEQRIHEIEAKILDIEKIMCEILEWTSRCDITASRKLAINAILKAESIEKQFMQFIHMYCPIQKAPKIRIRKIPVKKEAK